MFLIFIFFYLNINLKLCLICLKSIKPRILIIYYNLIIDKMLKKLVVISILFIILNVDLLFPVSAKNTNLNENTSYSKGLSDLKIKFLKTRFFLYKQPSTTPPENGFPVLFIFHGAVQHAFSWFLGLNPWNKMQNMFTQDALDKGFFVIAPESIRPFIIPPRAWDSFRDDISKNKDLLFIQNIIEWLNDSELPVDINNLFAAGFSSGGFMCSRIGYALGSQFNALAVHSGANAECINITIFGPVFDCTTSLDLPENHPPTIIIHGEKDPVVPFNCGQFFYDELQRYSIDSNLLVNPEGGHIWLPEFNYQMLDWFENYLI
jgi:poly(3-hydroxyoctanoate) depolymerase